MCSKHFFLTIIKDRKAKRNICRNTMESAFVIVMLEVGASVFIFFFIIENIISKEENSHNIEQIMERKIDKRQGYITNQNRLHIKRKY